MTELVVRRDLEGFPPRWSSQNLVKCQQVILGYNCTAYMIRMKYGSKTMIRCNKMAGSGVRMWPCGVMGVGEDTITVPHFFICSWCSKRFISLKQVTKWVTIDTNVPDLKNYKSVLSFKPQRNSKYKIVALMFQKKFQAVETDGHSSFKQRKLMDTKFQTRKLMDTNV